MTATTALLAPDRIQKLLDYARERGMTVEFEADERPERYRDRYCWVLKTADPSDFDQIWIFWDGPGANGGRTGIKLYRPFARRKPSRLVKLTFQHARSWVRILTNAVVS